MPLTNPILLNNFKRVIDPNENYLLNEGANAKYDGKSELKPGTILKVGRYGQFKMQVIQDLGDEIEIKNVTKNYKDTPFKRSKTDYKGAFIVESEINEEATTSWASMMKGVKSGGSGPWSLVATEYKKVIDQEINIKTKEILPAAFEAMRRKHPRATIHIEDAGGSVVWQEKK
jgi:hypothetical protein